MNDRRSEAPWPTFRAWLPLSIALVLGAVGCTREVRVSEQCASVAVPKGWRRDANPSARELITLRSPEKHRFGGVEVEDIFGVTAVPAGGMTLAGLRDQLARVTLADVQQQLKEHFKPGLTMPEFHAPVMTSTSVGSRPALRIVTDMVTATEGEPVAARTISLAVLVGSRLYQATASYPIAREQELKPAADAFLASFRLEGCADR